MKFQIAEDDKEKRLDVFCSEKFVLTRNKASNFIEKGIIKVNDKISKASYRLKINDCVELFLKEDDKKIKPKNIPLDILYEDKDLIVLNKPKNLICHPTAHLEEDSLVSALLYHTNDLSDIEGDIRRGIVHRLDKNTSGLMLVAKNNDSHIKLQQDIKTKKTKRKYLAVCYGVIEEDEGEINKPLLHSMKDTVKMVVSDKGLDSLTNYKVIERFNIATFLEITLQTGRTHQIRCHLSSINHPVINDTLYGANSFKRGVLKTLKTKEQVLMSYHLSFTHPTTGEIMEFEIGCDNYHPDLLKTLNLLRSLN